jgi:alkaline phosphatase
LGAAAADSVLLVVAGDMHANCTNPANKAKATAAIVERYPEALVIPLGDNAGQSGTATEYACYDRSWGKFKSRTYPTIGNHELNLDPAASPYYDYFNGVGVDSGRAGHRARGYYTLAYGGWRILVANSHRNLDDQTEWMIRELAADPRRCTMAIWHRPLFTSSAEPERVQVPGKLPRWWKVLFDGGADLVLHGHVHSYERFAEMRPNGVVDAARGIREIVVGTGGSGLFDFRAVPHPASRKRIKTWGVLKLTLWPTRYKWQFIDVKGVVLDQGQDGCH